MKKNHDSILLNIYHWHLPKRGRMIPERLNCSNLIITSNRNPCVHKLFQQITEFPMLK
ncbi:Uncharacterised protein [Legionella pneumophila]|nr:Uncharacterised protein [Legionella pneumophila]